MEEFKGTKGEWNSVRSHDGVGNLTYEIHCDGFNKWIGTVEDCQVGELESLANANLIASAPELLEALQKLTEITRFVEDNYEQGCGHLSYLEKAEQAINKALNGK
jgi:hypothetical protein